MVRGGWKTPTVAMRYQHATVERDQAIADRLGAFYRIAETIDDAATDAGLFHCAVEMARQRWATAGPPLKSFCSR